MSRFSGKYSPPPRKTTNKQTNKIIICTSVVQFIYIYFDIYNFFSFRRIPLIFTWPSVRFSLTYLYTPQPHFPGRLQSDKLDGRKLPIALTFVYQWYYANFFFHIRSSILIIPFKSKIFLNSTIYEFCI